MNCKFFFIICLFCCCYWRFVIKHGATNSNCLPIYMYIRVYLCISWDHQYWNWLIYKMILFRLITTRISHCCRRGANKHRTRSTYITSYTRKQKTKTIEKQNKKTSSTLFSVLCGICYQEINKNSGKKSQYSLSSHTRYKHVLRLSVWPDVFLVTKSKRLINICIE